AGAEADKLCVDKPPARPEGFLLDAGQLEGKPAAVVKGHDSLGLLWGITALNQMITRQDGKTVLKKTAARDYPDNPGKRGYDAVNGDAKLAWFAVQCLRPNRVAYRTGNSIITRKPPLYWRGDKGVAEWRDQVRKVAAILTPLGIPWHDGVSPIGGGEWNIRSKNEDDFQILLKLARICAENGGDFSLFYDDARFPIHKDDVRDFGSAREADTYFLKRFIEAMKKDYPNFKLIWCPPFYWGPLSDVSRIYGESRDEYLKAVGERLPPDVLTIWTGPRVKSGEEKPEYVQWITGLIKRPPVFYQNTFGIQHGGRWLPYDTDPIEAWPKWYGADFLNGIALSFHNESLCILNMTRFDYFWNMQAYDPKESVAEAGWKVVGPDLYPKFVEFYKALAAMDEYGWEPTAHAAKNLEEVKAKTGQVQKLNDELMAQRPEVVAAFTRVSYFMKWRAGYLKKMLADPNFKELMETAERAKELAARETGADPKLDIILTPGDFQAKRPPSFFQRSAATGRRFVNWINGAKSAVPAMEATFQLSYPLTGDSELVIAGLDHNVKPPCRIRIRMNGSTVFEGPNPFAQDKWTTHSFKVRGAFLRDGVPNTLKIESLEDADSIAGAPWFMLSYAVLRPERKGQALPEAAALPAVAPAAPPSSPATKAAVSVIEALPAAAFIAVGDLDGDAKPDLVAAERIDPKKGAAKTPPAGRLHIFHQKADGFAMPPDRTIALPSPPTGLALGDFDLDGTNDLAVALRSMRSFSLFLGREHLGKDRRCDYGNDAAAQGLSAGRLSGAGLADFMTGAARRTLGKNDQFTASYVVGPERLDNWFSTLADLDGDGWDDIIFTTWIKDAPKGKNNLVRAYIGPFSKTGDFGPSAAREFTQLISPFADSPENVLGKVMAGDVNGDSQKDLLVGARSKGQAQTLVYLQNSPRGFTDWAGPSLVLEGVTPLHAGDLNGDGLCDIIFLNADGKGVSIWLQQRGVPLTSGWKAASIPVAPPKPAAGAAAMGDIDGDGNQEAFIVLSGGGVAIVRLVKR
ncbi:MAG: FG-GAP-like repeat-containing protein, partial [Kiritimatiellae bacterium]|nr:FG-GAP-like repeat-containing protein [Kiritimatiellia bacterium]